MPRYQCHKKVWALKIKKVTQEREQSGDGIINRAVLEFCEEGYAPITVDQEFIARCPMIHAGGYYVVYEDGYKSFSLAKAFEDGYTRFA